MQGLKILVLGFDGICIVEVTLVLGAPVLFNLVAAGVGFRFGFGFGFRFGLTHFEAGRDLGTRVRVSVCGGLRFWDWILMQFAFSKL